MAFNTFVNQLLSIFRVQDESRAGFASASAGAKRFEVSMATTSKRVRSSWAGAFPAVTTLGTFTGLARSAGAFLKPAVEMQDALSNVRAFALGSGESFDEWGIKVRDAAQTAAFSVGLSSVEVVQGFTEMSKAGIDVRDALAALPQVTRLAFLGGMDVAKAADVATTLFNVWGFSGDELGHKLDQLAFVANETRLDYSELTDVITRSAGAVAVASPAYEDFLFILGKTRNVMQSASVTGTVLRRAYEELSTKADKVGQAFNVVTMSNGKLRDVSDILFEIAARGDDLTEVSRGMKLALGSNAVKPINAIILAMRNAIAAAGGSAEAARPAFFAMRNQLSDLGDVMKDKVALRMENNLTPALGQLMEAAREFVQSLPVLDTFTTGIQTFAVALKNLASVIELVSDKISKLGMFGAFLRTVFSAVGGSLLLFTAAAVAVRSTTTLVATSFKFLTEGIRENAAAYMLINAEEAANLSLKERMIIANARLALAQRTAGNAAATAAAQEAAAGTLATVGSATLGGVAGRIGLMGVLRIGMSALGWVGLAISLLLPLLSLFGSSTDELDSAGKAAGKAAKERTGEMVSALDKASLAFTEAVTRMELALKEPVATLHASTLTLLDRVPKILSSGFGPLTNAKFGPVLSEQNAMFQDLRAKIQAATLAGEPVSLDLRKQFTEIGTNLLVPLTGLAEFDKRFDPVVKALKAEVEGFSKQGATQETQLKIFEELKLIQTNTAKAAGINQPGGGGGGNGTGVPRPSGTIETRGVRTAVPGGKGKGAFRTEFIPAEIVGPGAYEKAFLESFLGDIARGTIAGPAKTPAEQKQASMARAAARNAAVAEEHLKFLRSGNLRVQMSTTSAGTVVSTGTNESNERGLTPNMSGG